MPTLPDGTRSAKTREWDECSSSAIDRAEWPRAPFSKTLAHISAQGLLAP